MPITRKIRIALSSFNKKILLEACEKIVSVVLLVEEPNTIKGPIPLPTRKRIYCVLRSPHVDKDSREQFEIRRYKRIIDLVHTSVQTFDSLVRLELPPGVAIQLLVDNTKLNQGVL
jgi:small subunit ribosomal protein S10